MLKQKLQVIVKFLETTQPNNNIFMIYSLLFAYNNKSSCRLPEGK
jgi:hypothetical protein